MTPTPTPRTDAILNLLPGGHTCDPQLIADELRGPIAELERELGSPGDLPDANTTAHARINWWKDRCDDLNNELADLREGFDDEGRTAAEACCVAFKAEQVEQIRQLERELEQAMKQNSRLPRSGMALGDLLARHGIIKAEALDDPEGFDGYATLDALCCAFEEMMIGRDPNNLEGPPPTDEERRENARAIQAMTVPERFALMFGHPPTDDEAGDPP